MDRQWRTNVQEKVSNISPQNKNKYVNKPNRAKEAQFYECEGFGHIRVEYPTFLKTHKKGFSVSWSDFDDEAEGETTNKVMDFIGKYESGGDSGDEDMIEEELAATFKLLHSKWEKVCVTGKKLKKTINVLLQ